MNGPRTCRVQTMIRFGVGLICWFFLFVLGPAANDDMSGKRYSTLQSSAVTSLASLRFFGFFGSPNERVLPREQLSFARGTATMFVASAHVSEKNVIASS